ncbi:MAG: D-glycero-alpha-D-manno-heptose-7-phosphate [Methylocystaceae bacterium]|nr:MAG: D-glycero-alpha-D-manno-heptose-7-phosphate [Methylocystaceae bacterium]
MIDLQAALLRQNGDARITRARAHLRLGLAGGGTDLSAYCQRFGGAILNVTIDRHAYAFISDRSDGKTSFTALDIGKEETLDPEFAMTGDAALLLHQGVYRRMVRDFLGGGAAAFDPDNSGRASGIGPRFIVGARRRVG